MVISVVTGLHDDFGLHGTGDEAGVVSLLMEPYELRGTRCPCKRVRPRLAP